MIKFTCDNASTEHFSFTSRLGHVCIFDYSFTYLSNSDKQVLIYFTFPIQHFLSASLLIREFEANILFRLKKINSNISLLYKFPYSRGQRFMGIVKYINTWNPKQKNLVVCILPHQSKSHTIRTSRCHHISIDKIF